LNKNVIKNIDRRLNCISPRYEIIGHNRKDFDLRDIEILRERYSGLERLLNFDRYKNRGAIPIRMPNENSADLMERIPYDEEY